MQIQIIGLPGSGKTTAIKKYLIKNKNIIYLDYAKFHNKKNFYKKLKELKDTDLIIESACGMMINNTSIIKYQRPIQEVYSNFNRREGYLDENYMSLLESKMIPAKYTVRTDKALFNMLDILFLKKITEYLMLKNPYCIEITLLQEIELESSQLLTIEKSKGKNQYRLLIGPNRKFLCLQNDEVFKPIHIKTKKSLLEPKDARQSSFFHSLYENEEILLSVCLGQAGTGKTSIALSYALDQLNSTNKKIVLSKPTYKIGKTGAFGPVPGDVDQKYAPYLNSYKIAIKKLLGHKSESFINYMIESKSIDFQPIEFVRGNTYENCTFILDEAQNLSWHELKSVISRIGQNTKLIILGDLYQKDISFRNNVCGIEKLITSSSFNSTKISTKIELLKQYRGPLADLVYNIDTENDTKK